MRNVSRQPNRAVPERMGALACLPVFLTLAGRRAVVIGGSEPARWKAELLAAAGARVDVLAPEEECCEEMLGLAVAPTPAPSHPPGRGFRRDDIGGEGASGTITLIPRPWTCVDLDGAAIAVADIEDMSKARAFVAAAREAGAPYNVIDKPELCQFQFGAIVNRSPLVVGISTAGAAPILGQAVRRRIETLLPRTLAAWAEAAGEIRAHVMRRLAPGPERRAFWERFADMAFGAAPETNPHALISRIEAEAPTGRVTLVGAGPGDLELLTIKAVRTLQSADVILFDDSVPADMLELARREAKRVAVGKGKDADAMMLDLVRQGRQVVRLAFGDPPIGEEIARLERQGIRVEAVPGIAATPQTAARLRTDGRIAVYA